MPDDPPTLEIHGGTCLAVFAFEVGAAIDLDQAEQRWRAGGQRESIRHSRRAPPHFEFKPAPLRLDLGPAPLQVAGRAVASVDAVLFDFGALSVAYALPLAGPIEGLLPLALELTEAPTLTADARARAQDLLAALGPAVRRPELADVVEDYAIFQITAHTIGGGATLAEWLAANRALLARILRAESASLSRQEVDDALAHGLSYADGDAVFVDWNAALLFDPHPQEVTAALEFVNVELLEMRHLDDLLDAALEETYALLDLGRARRPHQRDARPHLGPRARRRHALRGRQQRAQAARRPVPGAALPRRLPALPPARLGPEHPAQAAHARRHLPEAGRPPHQPPHGGPRVDHHRPDRLRGRRTRSGASGGSERELGASEPGRMLIRSPGNAAPANDTRCASSSSTRTSTRRWGSTTAWPRSRPCLKQAGHETRLVNLNENLPPVPTREDVLALVREWRPGLIAFSCLTQQYRGGARARALPARSGRAEGVALPPLIVGGIHPTMVPRR